MNVSRGEDLKSFSGRWPVLSGENADSSIQFGLRGIDQRMQSEIRSPL
jgi:hypothetical protein